MRTSAGLSAVRQTDSIALEDLPDLEVVVSATEGQHQQNARFLQRQMRGIVLNPAIVPPVAMTSTEGRGLVSTSVSGVAASAGAQLSIPASSSKRVREFTDGALR